MQKHKIDLQNLLAKYQTGSRLVTNQNYIDDKRQFEIEESFYEKKTQQPSNPLLRTYREQQHTQHKPSEFTYIGNFKMSKQQCQSFLLEILNQLNKQKKQLSYQSQIAYKQITDRFYRIHERVKKQLLELLDTAFKENERQMKEELIRQSKNESIQFNSVKQTIQSIEEQISGYLRQLRSVDYKKAISEVVLKDYSQQIKKLRDNIDYAKALYIQNLGEIEPDAAKIECLRNDLKSLFYFKKKTAKVIEKSIFSVLAPKPEPHYNNSSRYQQHPQAASRTRKSFFNFGN